MVEAVWIGEFEHGWVSLVSKSRFRKFAGKSLL